MPRKLPVILELAFDTCISCSLSKDSTLGDYIKTKRLEQVHFDLTAPVSREQKIAVIAKKWGFADLSTFARAFKGKYGYKPSEAKFT